MSFVIKNPQINLVVSIVPVNDSIVNVLATDFKRYFIEKDVNNDILDDRITELNALRFPMRKVLNALTESVPSKSTATFEDDLLKIEIEIIIVINETKSERLKLYFNLTECTTKEEISESFVNGLVKSILEQKSDLKVSLPEPSFQFSSNFIELFAKDVANILGAKSEKDLSQGILQRKPSDNARVSRMKKHPSRQMLLKPPPVIEKKKLEYKEDSQEFELTEDFPSTSTQTQTAQSSPPAASKNPPKKRKPNVKF